MTLLLAVAACDSSASNMPAGVGAYAGTPAANGGAGARAVTPVTGGTAAVAPAPSTTGTGGVTVSGAAGFAAGAGAGGVRVIVSAGTSGGLGGAAGSTAGSGGASGASAAAGSGGNAGAAGLATAGAGGAEPGGAARKPPCKTNPKQIIVIGDSYLNWITHSFPTDITREAGEQWRMYAVGGCSLGSGGLCLIPPQLDTAIKEDPDIIAAVMTGGGNDILIADESKFPGSGECKDRTDADTVQVCKDVVSTAMEAGRKLMQSAADAGISDVIYMFYPHTPGGGFGGMNPKVLLDYAKPFAKELCDGAAGRTKDKLHCHFIDLVPVFEGHPDWFADDGIHENSLGSTAMAKEVVKKAKETCVAQSASSGCCEP
ncbi:MAG: hypothetical protein RL701_7785 [Pseudomonadota bacterium]